MSAYTITWEDPQNGDEHEAVGTLPELAATLLTYQEAGQYSGAKIRVTNEAGWTVGWVDAGHWSAS